MGSFKSRNVFFYVILIFVVWLPALRQASAVMLERSAMRDVAPLIDTRTLVVFDIDNTLIEPTQSLGSDQWFRYVLQHYISGGVPADAALAKTLVSWRQVNEVTHVLPVERGTPFFVRRLQDADVKIIVLTARGVDGVNLTERQLSEGRMDFSRSTIAGGADVTIDKGLRYHHGLLFASGQDKGLSLVKFLRYFHLNPPKVVFVDDLVKNVQAVDLALAQANITAFNVRYGALDAKVRAFNPKVSLVEWGIFGKYHRLITDDEALRIMKSH